MHHAISFCKRYLREGKRKLVKIKLPQNHFGDGGMPVTRKEPKFMMAGCQSLLLKMFGGFGHLVAGCQLGAIK